MVVCGHTARLLSAASRPRTAALRMLLLLVCMWMLAMLLLLLLLWMCMLGVDERVLGVGVLLLLSRRGRLM